MRGAEAVVEDATVIGRACVLKRRVPKRYREAALDRKLRMERTRGEARLLHKAKLAQVPCPAVLQVGEFEITMERLEGAHPGMTQGEAKEAGILLARLHSADIIHGDYTPANLMVVKKSLFVIDFGLGFVSNDIEDKAVDVFTMLRAIGDVKAKGAFIGGYGAYEKAGAVLARVKEVEKRVRYAF